MTAPAAAARVRVEEEAGPDGTPGAIRVVTIDRPAVLNALDAATLGDLAALFEGWAAAPPRAVILTGAGPKAFVAGADIAELSALDAPGASALSALGHRVGEAIGALPAPVIAAVGGFALGGGCELALACDFIYASTAARFGQPEVKLGAIPGFGGTQRLPRRVGMARALELVLGGEPIDAAEALRIGLVNRVVEPGALMPAARAAAAAVAARAPLAVAEAKRAIRLGAERPLAEGLGLERDRFAALFATADLAEGMRAFLERRPPKWESR